MDLFQNKKAKNSIYSYWVFFSFLLKRDQNMEKLATSSMQPIDNSHKLHACIFHSIIWIIEEKFRKREVKAFFSGPFRVWKGGGILYKKKIQISHWRRITFDIFLSAMLAYLNTHTYRKNHPNDSIYARVPFSLFLRILPVSSWSPPHVSPASPSMPSYLQHMELRKDKR